MRRRLNGIDCVRIWLERLDRRLRKLRRKTHGSPSLYVLWLMFLPISRRPAGLYRGAGKITITTIKPPTSSSYLDFDLLRLGFFVLRQVHLEHALLERSLYFVCVRVLRQRESPAKTAVAALYAVIFCLLLFFFELALARDGKYPVLDGAFYVFFFYFRHFSLKLVFSVILG